jgi:hypothetical protein
MNSFGGTFIESFLASSKEAGNRIPKVKKSTDSPDETQGQSSAKVRPHTHFPLELPSLR